uniref:RhuM family protein n=1 Tax=Bifidobacterium xylocopae TaxID=2493119 RepID=UPI0038B22E7E
MWPTITWTRSLQWVYRVNSRQATKFRQWATGTLRQYIIKGFALNDDMLKNGRPSVWTTSTSCWAASATSGPPSGAFTRR